MHKRTAYRVSATALGLRGCRLGGLYPEITEMQERAIFEAVVHVAKKGITLISEVMTPLIGSAGELEKQKPSICDPRDFATLNWPLSML